MTNRDTLFSVVLVCAIFVLVLPAFWGRSAPDLAPLWVAANFVADGNWAAVYPDPGPIFTVTTPAEWGDMARQSGHKGLILAYIYPPIWAGLVAPLTDVISIGTFQNTMLVINHFALIGLILLARRIAAPNMPASIYLAIATIILASGPFAPLALFQNQPQILVSFLTLWAIERAKPSPMLAGAMLGLAVSLKIAPILLLPVFLVAGNWRPILTGFLIVGGGLGVLSILIAGWAVHLQFLSLLSTISSTVVLSDAAYTIDALIAQFGMLDTMDFIGTGQPGDSSQGWWVGGKPGIWSTLSMILILLAVAVFTLAARRQSDPLLWPACLIIFGLLGSVAWSFYFIAPLAFLPALLTRLGPLKGAIVIAVLSLPGSYLILPLARDSAVLPFADQALGVITLMITACVYMFLALRQDQPLRPRSSGV